MKNYSHPSVEELIQLYGFNSLNELFEYIVKNRWNGQHKQAKTIFQELPTMERLEFFEHLDLFYDVLHWRNPMYQAKYEYIADWKRYLKNYEL